MRRELEDSVNRANELHSESLALAQSGKLSESTKILRLAHALDERNRNILIDFINILLRQNCYDETESFISKGLQRFPDDYRFQSAKIRWYTKQHRFEESHRLDRFRDRTSTGRRIPAR